MPPWISNELLWLTRQIRPYLRWHLASFVCLTAGSFLALLTPLVLRRLIDDVLPHRQVRLLLWAMGLIFLANVSRTALTSLGNYLTLVAVQRMALRLRLDLLRQVDRLSAGYHENTQPGTVMYPFKEPVDEIAYFGSDLVPAILRTCAATAFTIGTMFMLSPALTWTVLPLIPIFLVLRKHFRARLARDSDGVQQRLGEWNAFLQEHIASIIPIQFLGREGRQERAAFRLLALNSRYSLKLIRSGIWFALSTSMVLAFAISAVIGCGGWSVISGGLSLGGMVAFYSFVTQLFDPLGAAAELYARAQRAFSSVRRLQSLMDLQPAVRDCPSPIGFPRQHWVLRFTDVKFDYQQQCEGLRVPFLEIGPGEQVAIIGENGAGKSTLARLMARTYDVECGSIQVDGVDLRHIRLASVRQHVGYLPRDPVLFDGTLASNLRFVRSGAPNRELRRVIQLAGLGEVVESFAQGLEHRIGPDGCRLSGGERQRLAIARALLQRPSILIVDEATSCLDPAAENLVLQNLRQYLPSATLILISHRMTAALAMDRILVLSRGRITFDGRPADLNPSPAEKMSVHASTSPTQAIGTE